MLAVILGSFATLLGLFCTVLGLCFLLKPDSFWVRLIRRVPEDVTLDEADLFGYRIIGFIALTVGAAISISSILNTFVW